MKDNQYGFLAFAAIALAIIWLSLKKKPVANPATTTPAADFPVSWDSPMTNVYDSNPNAFAQPTAAEINVNVGNQMASQLSDQYMPMFGFVGMAQGSLYQ